MKLHELTKTVERPKKRVGRGLGSGKGKTGGKGQKGQKARGTIPAGFIGGTLPLYRKLPLKRGQGNTKVSVKPIIVNLSKLVDLKPKTVVDAEVLVKEKIILEKDLKRGVKILGNIEIKNALTIKLPISESARKSVEQSGGKVENA
jgi:large subunit ribosomal protein L15